VPPPSPLSSSSPCRRPSQKVLQAHTQTHTHTQVAFIAFLIVFFTATAGTDNLTVLSPNYQHEISISHLFLDCYGGTCRIFCQSAPIRWVMIHDNFMLVTTIFSSVTMK
jgi:hypothetical protein